MTESTVLANNFNNIIQDEQNFGSSYSPRSSRLIEFAGAEGEDFRNFEEALESHFAMFNIVSEPRKLLILRAQLRRTAKSYFLGRLRREPALAEGLTYVEAIELLKSEYITPELITRYTIAFNMLTQGKEEHPKTFLGRLEEAAQLAELEDAEQQIKIRFQVGLLPEIRKFCILNSAATFNDYLVKAEGWWNAEKPRPITIKNSPFNPREIDNTFVSNTVKSVNVSTVVPSPNASSFDNPFSNSEFSVMDISKQLNSTLSKLGSDRNALKQLISSLQTLELHHIDSQNLVPGVSQDLNPQAEKQDIKEMIRQVMQEEFKKQNSGSNSNYRKNYNNYDNNNRRYNNNNDYYQRGGDARNYNNEGNNNYNQRSNNNNQHNNSENNNANQQSKN